jgi:hypothetical protein
MQTSTKPYLTADSISISGGTGEVGSAVKCYSCFGYFRFVIVYERFQFLTVMLLKVKNVS